MKVSSEHRAEMTVEIPHGLHVESRWGVDTITPRVNTLKIWSDSDESVADAVTKIIQMSDALVAALKETK